MKPTAELGLKELAKVLAALFPKQHERIATWLTSLEPVATEPEVKEVKRPVVPDRYPNPRPVPQRPVSQEPPRKSPTPNPSPPIPTRPPKPTSSLPPFARPWTGSASEWGRRQKGIDIPWDEEQTRVDSIIQQSGMAGWQQGFLSDLICLTVDLALASSRTAAVEMFIPRCRSFSTILAGVGLPGHAKRFFELNRSDLAPSSLRQIAEFGLP